jgi:hypothetical protein
MGQLSTLFYKNWLLYKHSVFGNIFEVVAPVLFICFICIVYVIDERVTYQQQSFLSNSLYAANVSSSTLTTAYLKYYLHYSETAPLQPWRWLPLATLSSTNSISCSRGSATASHNSPQKQPWITMSSALITFIGPRCASESLFRVQLLATISIN